MLRALFVFLALSAAILSNSHAAEPEPFVVHEWGVWIRTQAKVFEATFGGKKQALAGKFDVKTILGPPAELNDDLPAFVLRHDKTYLPRQEAREWRKPVIHLYGPENLSVSIQVSMPNGKPTAYWPKPAFIDRMVWHMGTGSSIVTGLEWTGQLHANSAKKLEPVDDSHWWKTLRDVPSKFIETGDGTERFLFYEATAVQEQPVVTTVGNDTLTLKNTGAADSGPIVVIVNDGKLRHCLAVKPIAANNTFSLDRTALLAADGAEEALLKTCRDQWLSFGMTADEAHAIVETWKPDLLTKTGFLVISRMPRDNYDAMFPITIKPQPEKLVRAGLVFDTLPGEFERLSWLPALRASMEPWVKDLSDDDFDVRDKAMKRFAIFGDIAAPMIQELAKSPDAAQRDAAATVLRKWELPPYIYEKPPQPAKSETKDMPDAK